MSKYRTELIAGFEAVRAVEAGIIQHLRVFQQATWLSIVGSDLKAYVCYDETNAISGYLPLTTSTKMKLSGFHVPPYTPYFGPLLLEEDIYKRAAVVEALLKPALRSGHLDFVRRFEQNDIIPFLRLGFAVEARQTHLVDKTTDYSLQQVHSSKRRYLKKLLDSYKSGKFVSRWGKDAVGDLLKLNQKTEERAGFRGKTVLLERLLEAFGDDTTVMVLYNENGKALAGAFCPRDAKYAYHIINASDRSDDSLEDKANLLSTYLMVESAIASGISFDFEGSNIPGVANFYRMMGGEPTINYRLQKSRSLIFGLMRAVQRIKTERNA